MIIEIVKSSQYIYYDSDKEYRCMSIVSLFEPHGLATIYFVENVIITYFERNG